MDPRYAPVRVGNTVRRPVGSSRAAVRELLLHLENVGFDAAPRYLGRDEQGRDVLTWIDGEAPLPPYPAWAMTDRALAELGGMVRRLHEATLGLGGTATDWSAEWADPCGGRVICHNDLYPENVVFRHGRPVALIDFAMAAPGRPLWDLAIATETWAPLGDPERRDHHPADLDGIARFGILARAYGVGAEQADELLGVVAEERAHAAANIRAEIARGNESWVNGWAAAGGDDRAAGDDAWLARHRDQLLRSVARP
jgi:aminoglycoside phosphotransferase (APT) family kinase protein